MQLSAGAMRNQRAQNPQVRGQQARGQQVRGQQARGQQAATQALAAGALLAFEDVRQAVSAGRRPISRASIARAAGLNEATLVRGLSHSVGSRVATVASAADGLLTRLIEERAIEERASQKKDRRMSGDTAARVAGAAGNLAILIGQAARDRDARLMRRIRRALEALDELLDVLPVEHHRVAFALRHLTHAWLEGDAVPAVRLALTGAAVAVVNAIDPVPTDRAAPPRRRAREAAHA